MNNDDEAKRSHCLAIIMSHPSRKKITMSFSLILCTLLSFRTIWQSNQLQTSYSESDDEKYGSFLPVLMERNNDDKLLSQCCSGRRIVALSDFDDGSFWPVVKNTTISNHKPSKKLQYPMSRSSKKQNSSTTTWRAFEQHWFEDCEPIPDVTIHPTCNSMHELDFFDESPEISLLSMEGSWRSVWKVTTANNSNNTMILKVLQLDREFDAESYEIHALDSIVMERLTASPYVVSSFGQLWTIRAHRVCPILGSQLAQRHHTEWKKSRSIGSGLGTGTC
jgi:hypothetical protein